MTENPNPRRVERERRALARLALQLVEADTSEALAHALAEITAELFEWDAFRFTEHVPGTNLYRLVHGVDICDGQRMIREAEEKPRPYPVDQVLGKEGSRLLNRFDPKEGRDNRDGFEDTSPAAPAIPADPSAPPFASLLFVPVGIGDETHGIVSVESRTSRRYDEQDLDILKALAGIVAPAMRRIRAERALRESQKRYREAIVQADAVPYRRDYRTSALTWLGDGVERLTGYSPAELNPAKLDSMIQEVVLHGEAAGLTRKEAEQKSRSGEILTWRADYRIVARDGTPRWLADSSIALLDEQGIPIGSLGILQDFTDRMRTAALNHTLSRLGRDLGTASTPREVGQVVARAAGELIPWDACFLNLYHELHTVECILSIDTVDGQRTEFDDSYQRIIRPSPILLQTIREGGVLVLREPGGARADLAKGTWGDKTRRSESLMFVPVREKGRRNVGVLSLQSYSPHAFSEQDLETLQILADHCGGALERAQTEQKLRESEKRAAAFAALAARLNSASTPVEAGHIIAETAQELIGWDACNLDLYSLAEDLTYDILNIDTVDGVRVAFEPDRTGKRATALGRRALREGAFLILRSARELAHPDTIRGAVRFGDTSRPSASLLFVPARKANRIVGIISIQSYTPNAYTRNDLDTLQALADYCGGTMERIHAEDRLALERKRIEIFAEIGRKLSAARSPREAGEIIVRAARELIGWDSCFLFLYSEAKNVLTPVFVVDLVDGRTVDVPHNQFLGPPKGYTELAIREGSQLILRSEGAVLTPPTLPFGDATRRCASMMYVPILRDTHVVGVLSIQSYRHHAYTRADLALLESLGQHCSGALERIQAEEALRESEERYALAAQGADDGLWDWNLLTGTVYFSPRLKEILGFDDHEIGDDLGEWKERVHPEDRDALDERLRDHLEGKTDHFESEHRLRHRDGNYRWALFRGVVVRDEANQPVRLAGSMTDITDRRAVQDQLVQAAFHDSLTSLPNRSLFLDRLGRCFFRHRRKQDYHFAVFFLDLHKFKRINDTLGHLTGDKLLIGVGQRIGKLVREGDTVARMGGDEFTVLLEDLDDAQEAIQVAERLLRELDAPFRIDGNEILSGASLGIALSFNEYDRIDDILRDADAALLHAKKQGKGTYVIYDPALHGEDTRFSALEAGLRDALARRELLLHYQPIVSIPDGTIQGVEALLRWDRPGHGLLLPGAFLPVAEETGLILPIGEWVLREVCRQLAEWRQSIPAAASIFVSVNLSPRQLKDSEFTALIDRVLDETSLDPASLHFEIAKEAIRARPDWIQAPLERLRRRGIPVHLDDVGTGFSSVAHLVHLPVDFHDIGMEHVGRLQKTEESRRVVRAIVGLAHLLHLKTMAEGVETREQYAALRDLRCDFGQGFLFSPPLDPRGMEYRLSAVGPTRRADESPGVSDPSDSAPVP